jgi:hypothetical protein
VSAVVAGSEEGYSGSDDEEVGGDDASDDDGNDEEEGETEEDEEEDDEGDDEGDGDFDAGDFGDADDTLTAGDGFAGGYVFSSRRPSESPR